MAKPWMMWTSFSVSPKKTNNPPTPSKPIEATVKPMTDPPKNAVVSAGPAPRLCAAMAVRTFTCVAEYMPINPATEDAPAPRKKASDSHGSLRLSRPPTTRAKAPININSRRMKTSAPLWISPAISATRPSPPGSRTRRR